MMSVHTASTARALRLAALYSSTSGAGLSTGVQHQLSSSRRSSTASVTPLGLGAARTPLRQWRMWARHERIHVHLMHLRWQSFDNASLLC